MTMKRNKSNFFFDIYNRPYDYNGRFKIYNSCKSSLQLVQRMSFLKQSQVHHGCVNSICWNNGGDIILSGSDDQHLILANPYNYQVLADFRTSHRANIFSAKFLPNCGDHRIVSCSGDGIILFTDLYKKAETFNCQFTCHSGTTYEIAVVPNEPHNFLSCGEDGTVRWFDLRIKEKCSLARCEEDILISCNRAVTAISVNPIMSHQVAIGRADSLVQIYDRRMLGTPTIGLKDSKAKIEPLHSFTVPEFEGNPYRITSLSFSPDGHDVLVSYSSDHLYLFSMKDRGRNQSKIGSTTFSPNAKKSSAQPSQPVRRLRLRGDWSDTGPDARPERDGGRHTGAEIAQARPVLHTSLMQRMTDVLSRMLNDPATRAALSGGGEDSFEGVISQQEQAIQQEESASGRNEATNDHQDDNESLDAINLHNNEETNSRFNQHVEQNLESSNDSTSETASPRLFLDTDNDELEQPSTLDSSNVESKLNSGVSSLNIDATDKNVIVTNVSQDNSNNTLENVQDRLTTLQDGFVEQHNETSPVTLAYPDDNSTNPNISLGLENEAAGSDPRIGNQKPDYSTHDFSNPGPSNSHKFTQPDLAPDENACMDSDDEDSSHATRRSGYYDDSSLDHDVPNDSNGKSHLRFSADHTTDYYVDQKFVGHRNASFFRTMIKEANFWGDNFIISGSDCGHVFFWDRETAKLVMLLEADQHVVNCVQPHPFLPLLATSGIDYDVKLWAPTNEEPSFDGKFAEDLMKRNAVMLEETKDTITVPAVFMIRMLACLNQIRRGRGRNRVRSGDTE
ncbi:DDB1- and CUL4-associated factor 6-like isoform X1 [Trichogramma pretiosum]|uniref:DDB1- and CUL4-associated factor 6-like isoform X1 n=1 Tax=Trichogramma pretiosum TaxID=7493 RepID=UPI0006C94BD9|nr:DDB1- and CUL4-associated factor 6-like isoform X1 [Trichogramma pretiosum]XP_014230003.1 DDB1- and CUL4-associated factor 6-like isoform X1 [Trichogramma pretiosum]